MPPLEQLRALLLEENEDRAYDEFYPSWNPSGLVQFLGINEHLVGEDPILSLRDDFTRHLLATTSYQELEPRERETVDQAIIDSWAVARGVLDAPVKVVARGPRGGKREIGPIEACLEIHKKLADIVDIVNAMPGVPYQASFDPPIEAAIYRTFEALFRMARPCGRIDSCNGLRIHGAAFV